MPSRASNFSFRKKRPRDANERAFQIVQESLGNVEPEPPDTRNPAAVALSKLGASKGGQTRAKNLSKARRLEIAKKAAKARWRKTPKGR
jgi:hypothetical protein